MNIEGGRSKTKHEGGKPGKEPRNHHTHIVVLQCEPVRYSRHRNAAQSDNGTEKTEGLLQQAKTTVGWIQYKDGALLSARNSTGRDGTELYITARVDSMSSVQCSVDIGDR